MIVWMMACGGYEDPFSEGQFPDPAPPAEPEAKDGLLEDGVLAKLASGGGLARPASAEMQDIPDRFVQLLLEEPPPPPSSEPDAPQARVWFPEAFLWRPEVVTDAQGTATLEVTVPDSLTTWRLLGLAHDSRGQQAGTVTMFDSTLPVYVDPVVPAVLYRGDRLLLPIQSVNTTTESLSAELVVEASGAIHGGGRARLRLAPNSTDVRVLAFDATAAGSATIGAALSAGAHRDNAERSIPVLPTGRPVTRTRSGTLSSRRSFHLPPPPGADAATERIDVLVFPGPLSVLQLELQRLIDGARPEDPAYATLLVDAIQRLSDRSTIETDTRALRRLRLGSWQRIVAASRAPDTATAADLLTSLHALPVHDERDDSPLSVARRSWIRVLTSGQRADGTWSRSERSTLQAVLVETASAARALPPDAKGPRLRAVAAIERHQQQIVDPYTASVVLASGLASGDLAERLRETLKSAISVDPESGQPLLHLDAAVRNPWGRPPSEAERAAWVVLALAASDSAEDNSASKDWATQILQGWTPESGFGGGRADALALEAVTTALGTIPAALDVSLALDGRTVATSTLDPDEPLVAARLSAELSGGDPEITVAASFGVPGLAFLATRRSYVPWSDSDRLAGVEVITESRRLTVGVEGELTLSIVGPSGSSVTVSQPLPSGMLVGEEAASRAESLGATLRARADRFEITTRPFQPGEILTLSIPVTPAFAGRFQTAPALVSADGGGSTPLRPMLWQVDTKN